MTQRILDIISGKDPSLTASATRCLMSALTPAYALASGIRNKLFDAGIKKSYPLGRPTISVGNLTTGGTGKTPMVAFIVSQLLEIGHHPVILLRGYKSTDAHGSDEAAVYRHQFGDRVPVIANPSRVQGAATALTQFPSTTCFVLDDGFQHRKAARDFDLVLIDATNPFGYDHLLPRGLMREPKAALKRADAIIITRSDQVTPEAVSKLDQTIQYLTGKAPIAHASHQWVGLLNVRNEVCDLTLLNDKPCFAAIAIGNPDAFVRTLNEHATDVRNVTIRSDHDTWPTDVIDDLIKQVRKENALLLTTEKDYVKWPALEESSPVYRVKLAMGFTNHDQQQALELRISEISDLYAKTIPIPEHVRQAIARVDPMTAKQTQICEYFLHTYTDQTLSAFRNIWQMRLDDIPIHIKLKHFDARVGKHWADRIMPMLTFIDQHRDKPIQSYLFVNNDCLIAFELPDESIAHAFKLAVPMKRA